MLLNQNEIDTIQNISSLEALKDYILNSVNTESNYTSDDISIRILSKEEYDKYIKNGICSGAITANSVNVWHYDNGQKTITFLCVPSNQFSAAATYAKDYPNHIRLTAQLVDTGGGGSAIVYTGTYHVGLLELLLNNNSNNNIFATNNYTLYVVSSDTTNKIGTSYGMSTTYIKNLDLCIKTNATYQKLAVKPWVYVGYFGKSYECTRLNLTFALSNCFRPVFHYKDNKKSKNIYY